MLRRLLCHLPPKQRLGFSAVRHHRHRLDVHRHLDVRHHRHRENRRHRRRCYAKLSRAVHSGNLSIGLDVPHRRRELGRRRRDRTYGQARRGSFLRPRSQSDGRPSRGYSPIHPTDPFPGRRRCKSSLARNSRKGRRNTAHSRSSRMHKLVARRCQSPAALEPLAQWPARQAVLLYRIEF